MAQYKRVPADLLSASFLYRQKVLRRCDDIGPQALIADHLMVSKLVYYSRFQEQTDGIDSRAEWLYMNFLDITKENDLGLGITMNHGSQGAAREEGVY